MALRGKGARIAAALMLALAAGPLLAQDAGAVNSGTEISVDAATIQRFSVEALQARRFAEAAGFAEALLLRDPADGLALTVLMQAAFELGDFTRARTAAAALYRSDAPQQRRYDAARIAALAALNEDRLTLSQLWLRRALIVAPTPEAEAQTIEDAAGVRRSNPWSTTVEFSFSPSNNVNGGAQTPTFEIDGIALPPFLTGGTISRAGQALSGWTGYVDLRTQYRFQEARDSRTTAGLRLRFQGAMLSADARAFLDGGTEADQAFGNGDLTSALVEFRLSHDRRAGDGAVGLEAVIGSAWTEGDYGYSFARVTGSRVVAVTQADVLRGALFYEQRIDTAQDFQDSTRYGVQGTWIRAFEGGGQLSSTLSYTITDSPDTQLSNDVTTVQVAYAFAEPVGPADLTLTVGAQQTLVPDFQFFGAGIPGGREDLRVFVGVDAFLGDFSYAGFAPVLTLDAGRTDSNVSRFDRDDFGLGLNFRSTF